MDRTILTKEQAASLLPDKEEIHTFRQAGPALLGADLSRTDVLDKIENYDVELSGPAATKMRHGMVLKDEYGYLFIETE